MLAVIADTASVINRETLFCKKLLHVPKKQVCKRACVVMPPIRIPAKVQSGEEGSGAAFCRKSPQKRAAGTVRSGWIQIAEEGNARVVPMKQIDGNPQ